MIHIQKIANSWKEIDVRNKCLKDFPTRKLSRTAHNEHYTNAMIGQIAFHTWKSNAMIGCTNYKRVIGESISIQCIKHSSNSPVQTPCACLKTGHITTSLVRI